MKNVVIVPIDGKQSGSGILGTVHNLLQCETARSMISHFKINDGVNTPDMSGPMLISKIKAVIKAAESKAGIFLDFKLADTSDTNWNTVKHFVDQGLPPDILTVRESLSTSGFLKLRTMLPDTKIALVSILTDTPEEECRRRNGMFPAVKLLNDITNIQAEYEKRRNETSPKRAFDMVVCSPLELDLLVRNFPYQYQYIVPGIRDSWMAAGQQARISGIAAALNHGATYCVAGSQMLKGAPNDGVSAEESRKLTALEIEKANYTFICPEDPMKVLLHCGGSYESPLGSIGEILGPLVGYAGKYGLEGKNFVGSVYFNFAKAEQNPIALAFYGAYLANEIREYFDVIPDAVAGMANGGVKLAAAVARELGCRDVTAYKKVIQPADVKAGKKEESILEINRHDVYPDDTIIIIEDVCNNFSTTEKAQKLIESLDAQLVGIACAINRDNEWYWKGLPVISASHRPSPQYKQEDPIVSTLIKQGKIVWKAKEGWSKLMEAMEEANPK
ncbi:hypothetical protein C0584_05025 [Candidatus Parcubacteria bacterium]|nr:MAG: hypothetical protein C0584_05025 [Candidatus Parcubacteria bacterium]